MEFKNIYESSFVRVFLAYLHIELIRLSHARTFTLESYDFLLVSRKNMNTARGRMSQYYRQVTHHLSHAFSLEIRVIGPLTHCHIGHNFNYVVVCGHHVGGIIRKMRCIDIISDMTVDGT